MLRQGPQKIMAHPRVKVKAHQGFRRQGQTQAIHVPGSATEKGRP